MRQNLTPNIAVIIIANIFVISDNKVPLGSLLRWVNCRKTLDKREETFNAYRKFEV